MVNLSLSYYLFVKNYLRFPIREHFGGKKEIVRENSLRNCLISVEKRTPPL